MKREKERLERSWRDIHEGENRERDGREVGEGGSER